MIPKFATLTICRTGFCEWCQKENRQLIGMHFVHIKGTQTTLYSPYHRDSNGSLFMLHLNIISNRIIYGK